VDLSVQLFLRLRSHFFNADGAPRPFSLPPKGDAQDDPFDRYLTETTFGNLDGVSCVKSGKNTAPDLVVYATERADEIRSGAIPPLSVAAAVEVKKIERTSSGKKVRRAGGADYNTTPPCGQVRVYDRHGRPFYLRGFYLFACVEPNEGQYIITALALVDGNLLNSDVELYESIVGERTKEIGLGTFGDGVNRKRPMMIFGNPLGIDFLDRAITLVHARSDMHDQVDALQPVASIRRSHAEGGGSSEFFCYRDRRDVPDDHLSQTLDDPFLTPENRDEATKPRGRFILKTVELPEE
jgi:hypothetical protein